MGASVAGPRASVCMRVRGAGAGAVIEGGDPDGDVGDEGDWAPAVVSVSCCACCCDCVCDGDCSSFVAADWSVLSSTGDVEVSMFDNLAVESAPCEDVAIVILSLSYHPPVNA